MIIKNTVQHYNYFKSNIKDMKIINQLINSQSEILRDVTLIMDNSTKCFQSTPIPEFNDVVQKAKQILSGSKLENHLDCQMYLIKINRLLDSITQLEPKFLEKSFDTSNNNLFKIKESVNNIGEILGNSS